MKEADTGPDAPMAIRDFQRMIHDRYYATDSARGPAKTFLWFAEEVGELAHALGKLEKGTPDRANLEEEFADVLAWLATLANICDVDLTKAIADKYIKDGGPEGYKV
jgi:NTP pyrophosphatase (non-canonical NTP hydrolase)